jgi:hypothetical protein
MKTDQEKWVAQESQSDPGAWDVWYTPKPKTTPHCHFTGPNAQRKALRLARRLNEHNLMVRVSLPLRPSCKN